LTRLLYYADSSIREFEGTVLHSLDRDGVTWTELDQTAFYPGGGGQPPDHGRLGAASVSDVREEEGRVWHRTEGALAPGGRVKGSLDWARRFDHMQQHTGQHILSAAFERLRKAPTLSSTLGAEKSVIEVGLTDIDWRTIEAVELAANQVLWDDRTLVLHWTDSEGIGKFLLRKPPKVSGRIRVVEVPEWDWSACGGTHTRRTGEVGAIKIVGWEKLRGNVRLTFLCGSRALRDHGWRTEVLLDAARRRSSSDRELIAHLERSLEERDDLRKRLTTLSARLIADEARAAVGVPPRPVALMAATRPRDEVRAFALQCLEAGAPWVISAAAAPEPSLVMARARGDSSLDLRTLVPELLAAAHGKGGGSADMVTIAPADEAAAKAVFALARERLSAHAG